MSARAGWPDELVLGDPGRLNDHVPRADQSRQRAEVEEILQRLQSQPGVILADEVGMGKTFVALAVAYTVARSSGRGPVVVMAPGNLLDKWEQDLRTFCELYLEDRQPVRRELASAEDLARPTSVRYGVARHSVEFMKLLDDRPRERCHIILLGQGAMALRQTDKWVRLALIAEALRRHGRGKAVRLIQVKNQIHRFLARLLWAIGEERAHGGDELWQRLLQTTPEAWRAIYNDAVREGRQLSDDPVPKSVSRAIHRVDLKPLAEALERMPVRAGVSEERDSERIDRARDALREVERDLWKDLLVETRWRSPLLVMDEAHHLKNPGTALARQLQSPDAERALRTGDGAMAQAFDRMLFLTATPFQLGHRELVRVLQRFGDVRWDAAAFGDGGAFRDRMSDLERQLDDSQRTAIALQRAWGRLRPEDCGDDAWWETVSRSSRKGLTHHQRAVLHAFEAARNRRAGAEKALRPWIVRHNKGALWAGTETPRRERLEGAALRGTATSFGLPIPPEQLLPFFLAARSAVTPTQDLLGEALSSSYEAFRFTRQNRDAAKDEQEEPTNADLAHAAWYLGEFDRALERCTGAAHPKVQATVHKAVDLWEKGEKVLVFAFYRRTCRALRLHISEEIERRLLSTAQVRLRAAGTDVTQPEIRRLVERIQERFFDRPRSPGRRALDGTLDDTLRRHDAGLAAARVTGEGRVLAAVRKRGILTGVVHRESEAFAPAARRRSFSATKGRSFSAR